MPTNDIQLRERLAALYKETYNAAVIFPPFLDGVMSLFEKYASRRVGEAQTTKLLDWSKENPLEVHQLLGMLVYNTYMEDTNATDVTFKLKGFSKQGKVLGDLELKATIRKEGAE